MMWYGLTRDEAKARCEALGLEARFTVTMDPKADAGADAGIIPKVIRAREESGAMEILLGWFAEGTVLGRLSD